jgi:RHS repeat-associated protein
VREISIIFEPGATNALASLTTTEYDSNADPEYFASLNVKRKKAYDYVVVSASTAASASLSTATGWFSSASPAVVNEFDYLYDSNYKARNMNGLVTESRVQDASANVKAKTHITYDEVGTYPIISAGTNAQWTDPSTNYRGHPTTVRSYYDIASSSYIDTHAQYDNFGNVRKAWDGNGNLTQTDYSSTYQYAYPTSVTTPVPDSGGTYGSSTAFTSSTAYDLNTALPTSSTDINAQTTTISYADPTTSVLDPLLRVRKVTAPNGQQTTTEYGDIPGSLYVKASSQIDSSNWKVGYKYFDNLGRTIRTRQVDDAGDVYTLACYDNMGRVSKTTNPFRGYSSQTCSTTTGLDWTSNTYDAYGRATSITTPDAAHVDTAFALATSGSQIGTQVTVTDQAGKVRRSITNALGQLTRVDEPNSSNQLDVSGNPYQPTLYTYDLLNNLLTVTQASSTTAQCGGASSCSQTRTFTYDALSRLKSAANPESGTINYTYDANSNLYTKTDARSITTTYTYDLLNRVKLRDYSDSTPDVTYYYDNITNGKGKLKKVTSSISTTEYTGFDILGRVTAHKQTTDGTDYVTGYTYDLAGNLLKETYPSGRVVKNVLDTNGDLSLVESKKNSTSGYWHYADSFTYNPAGAVTSMQLGNGRWESTVFNSHLQPTQIALGGTPNATNLLKLDYTYNTTGNADNNGNVLTQTITVPGLTPTFNQTYTYDELNRLASATETYNSSQTWKQEFSYDRYGNRSFVTGTGHTDTLGSCTTMCNPTISSTTNRITSSGYTFDSSGNTTADPTSRTFVYDAENRQTSVSDTGGTVGQYSYDGDGKRVKKYVPGTGETTVFVYDVTGKSIAEYSTIVESSSTAKVSYVTSDHLGSPRINTDANGTVTARHDYMPFGEEISTSQRTSGVGYAGDTVRKKFTGYEKDAEADEDFAEARYYSSATARFNSVDPLMASASIYEPQTFNRYAYVTNNPLNETDPSGSTAQSTAGTLCPEGKTCDENGEVVEFNPDGSVLGGVVATVQSLPAAAEQVAVKTVEETAVKWPGFWEMLWHDVKKTPGIIGRNAGKVGGVVGRGVSVLGIILTNPLPNPGCDFGEASPGVCRNVNPDPIISVDTSANPNPGDNQPNTDSPTLSKKRDERPDTGFRDLPDEEISRRARNREIPGPVRRKYQKEDKVRKNRNVRKRNSK